MSEVVLFVPRSDLTAQENLDGFIDVARRQLTMFGADLPFDQNEWPLNINLKSRRGRVAAVFSDWDTAGKRDWVPMPEPFLAFSKAYFRYQHGMRPTKAFTQRLAVLRALCKALAEHDSANVTHVDGSILNRATQLLKENFEDSGAYRAAMQLEMVADFLDENSLTSFPLQWKQPLKRPQGNDRVGEEFENRRNEKLPSPDALDALARIYRSSSDPITVLVTSLCAVMLCAPERVNEITLLKASYEHRDVDSNGKQIYGLRYWPSKGAAPQIKWILPSMVSLCEEALNRVTKLTDEARRIARWYENTPGKIYLTPELECLRGKNELTMSEVAQVVFVGTDKSSIGRQWCLCNKVALHKDGRKMVAKFSDIEDVLLSKLPAGFPILDADLDLKFSEALCVLPLNFFHRGLSCYRGVIMAVATDDINSRLGGRSRTGIQSIFSAFQFKEIDGSEIKITTHQFRHYLNTLAQMGGLNELDIAKWSGRKEMSQNRAYDHQSGRDLIANMRGVIGEDGMVPGSLALPTNKKLVLRSEFAGLKLEAAHTTDFGYCIHNFVFSPCQLHLDCINCNESVCVKGEAAKEANLRQLRDETQSLIDSTEAAVAASEKGAGNWLVHQKQTLARVEELLSLIDSPAIAPGDIIWPSQISQVSKLGQAHARRVAHSVDSKYPLIHNDKGGNS